MAHISISNGLVLLDKLGKNLKQKIISSYWVKFDNIAPIKLSEEVINQNDSYKIAYDEFVRTYGETFTPDNALQQELALASK